MQNARLHGSAESIFYIDHFKIIYHFPLPLSILWWSVCPTRMSRLKHRITQPNVFCTSSRSKIQPMDRINNRSSLILCTSTSILHWSTWQPKSFCHQHLFRMREKLVCEISLAPTSTSPQTYSGFSELVKFPWLLFLSSV